MYFHAYRCFDFDTFLLEKSQSADGPNFNFIGIYKWYVCITDFLSFFHFTDFNFCNDQSSLILNMVRVQWSKVNILRQNMLLLRRQKIEKLLILHSAWLNFFLKIDHLKLYERWPKHSYMLLKTDNPSGQGCLKSLKRHENCDHELSQYWENFYTLKIELNLHMKWRICYKNQMKNIL